LALILAGAVGNLIDRIWLGQVIDFIQLYYDRWYWPVFNIADIAIPIGAALLVVDSLRTKNADRLRKSVGWFLSRALQFSEKIPA
jgi:signal peptidase II